MIDASNQDQRVIIDLRQGEMSSIGARFVASKDVPGHPEMDTWAVDNVGIAFGSVIEQAKGGSADDLLIGNVENNHLSGGGGDDWLLGDGLEFDNAVAMGMDFVFPLVPKTNGAGVYDSKPTDNESGNDSLDGGANNDHLLGGAGDDSLQGASGNDTLVGGFGYDKLEGGADNDRLDSSGDAGDIDPETGIARSDTLDGGTGTDTLLCAGWDTVLNPEGGDVLYFDGMQMTGGTWQLIGYEFIGYDGGTPITNPWYGYVGKYGEIYTVPEEGSGLQIEFDDKTEVYVNNWSYIDVVQVDGWDAKELGIQLTGGPGPNAPLFSSGGESSVAAAASFGVSCPGLTGTRWLRTGSLRKTLANRRPIGRPSPPSTSWMTVKLFLVQTERAVRRAGPFLSPHRRRRQT